MGNIHVSSQVYDAVQRALQNNPAGSPQAEISPEEMQAIEQALIDDDDLSGEEGRLLEALRHRTQFTLSDGQRSTPISPLAVRFPDVSQMRTREQLRTAAAAQIQQATPIPPTQGSDIHFSPRELIESAPNILDLAMRQLDTGNGAEAAAMLDAAAREMRLGLAQAQAPERGVIETLAHNLEARARAYRQENPDDVMAAAGSLNLYARNARVIAEGLSESQPEYAQLLQQVGQDSRIQAEMLYQSAANSKSMLGQAVSSMYRDIADASLARDIANTGDIHNLLTGSRDTLERDRARMTEAFDYLDQKMQTEGLTFHEAWHQMFRDHRIADRQQLPTFPTAHEAVVFIRDHASTRGLLEPMASFSEALYRQDAEQIDLARGRMVEALRSNDQWELARQVLDQYQADAASPAGQAQAEALDANESGAWWRAKAASFVQEDLPVLLLTGVVSGGVGAGARLAAGAAGWGARASRLAQVSAELGSFVPTERLLNDAINGRRADWSGGALARDYALTVGSYGLFRALGAGWQALRRPSQVQPTLRPDPTRAPDGSRTAVRSNESAENILALTREYESAQILARQGYQVTQNPRVPGAGGSGVKMPDYRINGHLFDNYAPNTSNVRNIWGRVQEKVQDEQARRIVLNLDDSGVSMEALQRQFRDWPIENLEQVLVIRNGQVTQLALPRPQTQSPWFTPAGYPYQEQE